MKRNKTGLSYWLPLLLVISIGFDIPIAMLVVWSIGSPFPTLDHYKTLFESTTYARIYYNTFSISALVTIACVVLGYPLAYWMTKLSNRRQVIAFIFILLPFWISVLVRTYAWIVILGNGGLVNRLLITHGFTDAPIPFLYNTLGVSIGMINILLPYLVLPLYASMRRIDGRLTAAAKSLGASDLTAFTKVFLPLSMPALAASTVLVFILAFGFYVTPGHSRRGPRHLRVEHARSADQRIAALGTGLGAFGRAARHHAHALCRIAPVQP